MSERTRILLILALALPVSLLALGDSRATDSSSGEEPKATPLMRKTLPDFPGKEALVLLVEYAPGQVAAPHRHDAHVFVYVMEGSIEMQLAGGKPVILKAGDTFYEDPRYVHQLGRNLSKTQAAKLVVFFLKNENVSPVLPPTTR
jgi:quercetin dioxygenase-like cupin family protein